MKKSYLEVDNQQYKDEHENSYKTVNKRTIPRRNKKAKKS